MWPSVRLGDVVDNITVAIVGKLLPHYVEYGVPCFRSLNVRPHRVDTKDLLHISREYHESNLKSRVLPGDVLTVRTGEPGTSAVVPPEFNEANAADVIITRPGKSVDARWLSYYLNSTASHYVKAFTVGAVQQHFNVASIKSMTVELPSLPEQHAIAEVLGALDDKIASNALLVSASDDVVGARFATAIIADAAEVPLTTLADFVNGRNFTKDATGDGRVVIRIAELRSGVSTSTVRNDVEAPVENVAEAGDILFSWSGSLRVQRWYGEEGLINQHLFKVIPKPAVPKWLVHQVLVRELQDFQAIAADKATTMGHIQRRHLERSVRIPGRDVMASVESSMAALWARALAAEQESRTLASLRDTLLPALMSGRLRVRDAEKQVEEAL